MPSGAHSSHPIGTSPSRGMAARITSAGFAAAIFLAFGLFYGPAAPAHADPTTVTDAAGVVTAFSAATSTASSIKLGNNITVDQGLTLDAGEILVIDLNGHTLTVNGSSGTSAGAGDSGPDGADPGGDGGAGGSGSAGGDGGDGGAGAAGAAGTSAGPRGGSGGSGGDGGNGGNGGDGGNGGNGGNGAPNPNAGPFDNFGGDGGRAGDGGNGGDGSAALTNHGTLVLVNGTVDASGGDGGDGGSGGDGGDGGDGLDANAFCGGDGGAGGDGGDGGEGGGGLVNDGTLARVDNVSLIAQAGQGGARGIPGRGGPGGTSPRDCSDGRTGASGSDAAAGADGVAFQFAVPELTLAAPDANALHTFGAYAATVGDATSALATALPGWPARTGYTFDGWFDAETGGDQAGDGDAVDGQTLYAQWTINSYTVTFDSAGGSAVGSAIVDFDATIPGPPTSTLAGYTLDGWFTAASGGTAWDFAKDTVAGDVTLYAHWTINTYTVTFHDGDSSTTAEAEHGSHVTKPPDPSRDGFGFAGWYANPADIAQWDFENGVVTGDLDLYARWLPVTTTTSGAPSGTSPAGGGQPTGSTTGADATSDAASETTAQTTAATTGTGAAPTSGATSAAATGPTSELGVGSAGQQESLGYTGTNVVRVALLGLVLLLAGAGGLLLFRRGPTLTRAAPARVDAPGQDRP